MAKKKKNQENLPEGMSRRQAKLAKRAQERAKLAKDARPFEGFAAEMDLIALQEFVPSAYFHATVAGVEAQVSIVTVLPGAVAALRRSEEDGGEILVALQAQRRGDNPNRDLAYALNWAHSAQPGSTLEVGVADGSEPELGELLDKAATPKITVAQDFNWWLPEDARDNPQIAASLQRANDSILPSHRVEASIKGAAWWINPGEKAHIRWVRPEEETKLLHALARLHAAGELHVGEGSKFAGVFRTHGVLVPVWDVDNTQVYSHWIAGLEALEAQLQKTVENDDALSAQELKSKQTIISREVTIR